MPLTVPSAFGQAGTPVVAQTAVWAQDNGAHYTYPTTRTANRTTHNTWETTLLSGTHTNGKYYIELQITALAGNGFTVIGMQDTGSLTSFIGDAITEWGFISVTANNIGPARKITNNVASDYGAKWDDPINNIIMLAMDLDNAELYFGVNGAWYVGSDPSTNTAPAFTGVSTSNVRAGVAMFQTTDEWIVPTTLTYALPTGYSIW